MTKRYAVAFVIPDGSQPLFPTVDVYEAETPLAAAEAILVDYFGTRREWDGNEMTDGDSWDVRPWLEDEWCFHSEHIEAEITVKELK